MCSIKFVPDTRPDEEDPFSYKGVSRKPEIMSLEAFKIIVSKFTDHVKKINILSLHGCGESLLDKTLPDKVGFAKRMGFREIGFTTNCTLLKKDVTEKLLEAGLNCIIPSIDGTTKEVHEAIRPGTDFDRIIENMKYFINYRDKHHFNCKVLVRMIRQRINYRQWDEYNRFWSGLLDVSKGDRILGIDVHNTGGRIKGFEKMKVNDFSAKKEEFEKDYQERNDGMCPDIFSRLSIFTSGDVALCSADQAQYFKLGNVLEEDPIEIFNNETFSYYREKWISKEFMKLNYCSVCTIAISRASKTCS
jgi:sulfatase maturation enzyme AslB (radical SAM superfamily)